MDHTCIPYSVFRTLHKCEKFCMGITLHTYLHENYTLWVFISSDISLGTCLTTKTSLINTT